MQISNDCCDRLTKAIEAYILKANKKLADKLKDEGFPEAKKTVATAEAIEDNISARFTAGATELLAEIEDSDDLISFYENNWAEIKASNLANEDIPATLRFHLDELFPSLSRAYMKATDPELPFSMTQRATGWIKSWSEDLGTMMNIDYTEQLENILVNGIDEGKSITDIAHILQESGFYNEYSSARRTAITEVLGAHSVAQQEAFDQSPVVSKKKWKHTVATKPRQNHIDMDGQIVDKNKPFELIGADGVTYHPMYPRDTILPAGERINCHCISSAVIDDEVLGYTLEERKAMRDEAIKEIDSDWAKELDKKNKDKRGINDETIKLDWIRQKTKAGQIKYLGSKNRWALIESGVVTKDEQLFHVTKTEKGLSTRKKTLQELSDDGIITVSASTVKHVYEPHFTRRMNPNKPPSEKNGGRPYDGGHSQFAMDKIIENGWDIEITKTYKNGVRVGNIPKAKESYRRTGSQMSWFPSDWSEDDILLAGTYVSNNPSTIEDLVRNEIKSGERLTAIYNGVKVCVTKDTTGKITSIYPRNIQ